MTAVSQQVSSGSGRFPLPCPPLPPVTCRVPPACCLACVSPCAVSLSPEWLVHLPPPERDGWWRRRGGVGVGVGEGMTETDPASVTLAKLPTLPRDSLATALTTLLPPPPSLTLTLTRPPPPNPQPQFAPHSSVCPPPPSSTVSPLFPPHLGSVPPYILAPLNVTLLLPCYKPSSLSPSSLVPLSRLTPQPPSFFCCPSNSLTHPTPVFACTRLLDKDVLITAVVAF